MGIRTYDGHTCVVGKKDWITHIQNGLLKIINIQSIKQGTEYGALWNTHYNYS